MKYLHNSQRQIRNDHKSLFFYLSDKENDCYNENSFDDEKSITKDEYHLLLTLLNPIAPHITEELNESLGFKPLCETAWPEYDEKKTIDSEIEIPVQINGKVKGTINISLDEDEASVKEKAHNEIENQLDGKTIIKEIYVKNKIYNIVVR